MQSLQQFDIRTVKKSQVDLILSMFDGDRFMGTEMVDRHKGIAKES